jgi:hydroxymethylbilane synthase
VADLRIGSRGSQLALWQANHVADALRARGHSVEIEIIKTTGDKITEVALAQVGTKGMFTKEIEDALADKRVDLAVHSLKDVPTELMPGFAIGAVLQREDPRDAFVSARFADVESLPQGAHVGTSSLRRQAQLKAIRSDLRVSPLRGNVDTRLKKLEAGDYDAIILAQSGLKRLQRTENVRALLDAKMMCPAAGQGALAIEVREGDPAAADHIAFLDHLPTRIATLCERAVLNALGGGCQVPIGVHAQVADPVILVQAVVARPDGSEVIRLSLEGDAKQPKQVGDELGRELLAAGAQKILDDVYRSGAAVPQQP